jgi:hypothetical protein
MVRCLVSLARREPAAAGRAPAAIAARPRFDDGVTVRLKVNLRRRPKPGADHGLTVEATSKLTIVRSEIDIGENRLAAHLAGPEQELGVFSEGRCRHGCFRLERPARESQRGEPVQP